ncbi:MAG TPA: hypothetical protein HA252_06240 [Candidatus Diapherotrites archaeon]|uniref:Uncharacterized protein n=1 Tax=Candidatus Iainarchaeum sp. TaxID=3101447 RepID=A0A7J4JM57_9ARCH|nr:hypothetical protein [Candidatus Diapherotrites archaeon]HIH16977.1 hypothetical protein [Candidatus Diapherotrites archaeon]
MGLIGTARRKLGNQLERLSERRMARLGNRRDKRMGTRNRTGGELTKALHDLAAARGWREGRGRQQTDYGMARETAAAAGKVRKAAKAHARAIRRDDRDVHRYRRIRKRHASGWIGQSIRWLQK